MSDEEIKLSAGLHLEARLCQPHACGAMVNTIDIHGFSCRKSAGWQIRHNTMSHASNRRTIDEETIGTTSRRREETGRSYNDSMVTWKMPSMGRNRIRHLRSHPSSADIINTNSISRQSRGEEYVQVSATCTNTCLHAVVIETTEAFNAEAS